MQLDTISITEKSPFTQRRDAWWLLPACMLVFGGIGLGYLTWAAFQNEYYSFGPYHSPIYSTPFVPSWWTISPAFLLLWIPAGFRITCYYGRKAYYRAAFADPIACAVEEPYRKHYRGETRFPFILQNLHRYFLYLAMGLLALHWYDLFTSVFFSGELVLGNGSNVGSEASGIYLGVGTLLLFIDTLALTFYVGGCHSLRHLVGGGKRCFSCSGCSKISYGLWKKVSFLNAFHNRWFWISFFSIAVADLYIRLLAMGVLKIDPHVIW